MNLAIDIGNSRTKTGLFSNDGLATVSTLEGQPALPLLIDLIEKNRVSQVGIASVGTQPTEMITGIEGRVKVLLIEPLTPVPIRSNYQSPQTLGIDRLCAVVAGSAKFPNSDVLVIDAGTCITYDLVDRDGVYQGGGISPGINMRLEAMHRFTARLPEVNPDIPLPAIGLDTVSSMRFGAQWGTIAEVNGLIAYFQASYPQLKVILTGGDRSTFEQHVENPIFAAPNLVLEGINLILQHNDQDQ